MDTAVDDCEKGFSEKTPLLGASESGSISNYSHSQSHAYGSHASGAGRRGPGTVSRSTTPIDSTPHTLSIIDVSYTVKDTVGKWWQGALLKPRVTKEVLKRVNLHLKSGETVAILGNSGSGKTSLLDVVSYRTAKNGTVTGAIFLDSVCWNANLVKTEASYVMQADRLLVNLSVRETLYYIARLKFAGDKRRFRSIRERFSFKTNIEPNLMDWNKNQFDDEAEVNDIQERKDREFAMAVSAGTHEISDSESDDHHIQKTKTFEKESDTDSDKTVELFDDENLEETLNKKSTSKKYSQSSRGSSHHDISESESDENNGVVKVFNSSQSSSVHDISDEDEDNSSNSQQNINNSANSKGDESDQRPWCKFGKTCFRRNPSHLKAYRHPELRDVDVSEAATSESHGRSSSPPAKRRKVHKDPGGKKTSHQKKNPVQILEEISPYNFLLTKVVGIPDEYNRSAIHIKEILSPCMGNLIESAQFNYCIDIPWLMQQYPQEYRSEKPVLIVHGMQRQSKQELVNAAKPFHNVTLCQAKLDMPYGTHHTKMMFLLYDNGLRVVIHTANLIQQDWYQKTQGVWISPVFPKLSNPGASHCDSATHFKRDLLEYVSAYKAPGLQQWERHITEHDMSQAKVHIIGSIPGRHTGSRLNSYGHLKLRKILESVGPERSEVKDWPVIGQFSSVGSMGANKDAWLCGEWLETLGRTRNGKTLPQLQLIFPSKDNVRLSLEGYPAGASVPYSIQTARKQTFLHHYFHQWKAENQGRSKASPHIKTYMRASPDYKKLAWFLVTSSNLSKAAWGAYEKQKTQLMIRSYELGVLCVPNDFAKNTFEVEGFPVPYDLPPTPYTKQDRPWIWDIPYTDLPDTNGNMWCPS